MTNKTTKNEPIHALEALDRMLKDLLGLAQFHRPIGGDHPNMDLFCRYTKLAILCAETIAPYQSPKLVVRHNEPPNGGILMPIGDVKIGAKLVEEDGNLRPSTM